MSIESTGKSLEPVTASVDLQVPPDTAFDLFTNQIASWWPLAGGHSVFGTSAAGCGIQPLAGGELFELSTTGQRAVWGRVHASEPGARIQFSWFPGRTEATAQKVDVTFLAIPGGTRVHLHHRDWHALGERAAEVRNRYAQGWPRVLACLARWSAAPRVP